MLVAHPFPNFGRLGRWCALLPSVMRNDKKRAEAGPKTLDTRKTGAGHSAPLPSGDKEISGPAGVPSLALLRTALDAQRDAVMVHQGGRVIYANRAWACMLALPDAEALFGRHVSEALPPQVARVLLEVEAACDGEPLVREFQAEGRELESSASAILLHGARAVVS